MPTMTSSIALGSDRLIDSNMLRGRSVGVVSNPASIDASFRHIVDRVQGQSGATLKALFGPQHGFRSDVQDNMIETAHTRDETRRVPIYSLYSETREPTAEMLDGIELLVIDLQDVGTRVYTYIYTMANCLRACRKHGVRAVVCDRPNPIGGLGVEGPVLEPEFSSFVGQFPIPLRHGMTIGELARLFNEHFGIGADLEVIPMEGWRRSMYFDATGLPWVMPSPNIPTLDTTTVYPGMVLFEGTNISEGRGTTRPFELMGAPWIDGERFARRLNDLRLPGVLFRPVIFEPTFHKHARQPCGGCQIHVRDRASFRPVETAAALLVELRRAAPDRFGWRSDPYEYEFEKRPFDLLAGTSALAAQIEEERAAEEIAASWRAGLDRFHPVRDRYLTYRG